MSNLVDEDFIASMDLSPEMSLILRDRFADGYRVAWTFALSVNGPRVLYEKLNKAGISIQVEPGETFRFTFEYDQFWGFLDDQDIQIYTKTDLPAIWVWAKEWLDGCLYGSNPDHSIKVHIFSKDEGKLQSKEVFINKKTFAGIREDLYPDIDIKELNKQFLACDENVLILHGQPGTGKTTFIKYMLSHLSEEEGNKAIAYAKDASVINSSNFWAMLHEGAYDKLILDDADGLLTPRSETVNKGLSELLSFSDGMIPNRTKIIITTNQEVKEIDEAIIRPGRCFDFLVLEPMTYAYAKNIWVNKLGNTEASFNTLFKDSELVTQASLMGEDKRIKLDMKTRNYIKNGDTVYSIAQKLESLGIKSLCNKKNVGF